MSAIAPCLIWPSLSNLAASRGREEGGRWKEGATRVTTMTTVEALCLRLSQVMRPAHTQPVCVDNSTFVIFFRPVKRSLASVYLGF